MDKKPHFLMDDVIDIGKKPMEVSEVDKKIIEKMNKEMAQGKYDA